MKHHKGKGKTKQKFLKGRGLVSSQENIHGEGREICGMTIHTC